MIRDGARQTDRAWHVTMGSSMQPSAFATCVCVSALGCWPHLRLEAHVEHAISLIQHNVGDAAQG